MALSISVDEVRKGQYAVVIDGYIEEKFLGKHAKESSEGVKKLVSECLDEWFKKERSGER